MQKLQGVRNRQAATRGKLLKLARPTSASIVIVFATMKKEAKKLRLDRTVVQTLTHNLSQEQLKAVAGGQMADDPVVVRTATCAGTC